MNHNFINRERERENFKHLLQTNYDINKIVILHSNRGVGKSEFTQVVLDNQNNRIPLKIKMDDVSQNDLSYIKEVIETIDELAQSKKFKFITLETFIKLDKSKDGKYNYKLYSSLINTYKILVPLKIIAERNLAKGEYSTDKILNNNEENLEILINYIRYNLENNQVILNIENIQSIDTSSLYLILDILDYITNSVFILEYTTNATNITISKETLEDKCYQIKSCKVQLEELEMIPLKEILMPLINPAMIKEFKLLIDNLKITYDGNIRNIRDYVAILDKNDLTIDININDATNKRIGLLTSTEINLLSIIAAYPNQLTYDVLQSYYINYINDPFNDLDLLLEKLKDDFIIKFKQNILLAQDTIRQVLLTQDKYQRYSIIAYNNWLQYYQNLSATNDYNFIPKIEVLTNLFYLYIKIDKKNIFNILKQIKSIIIENSFTTTALQHMQILSRDMFSNHYTDKETRIIQFTLIDLYYFLGLHDEGLKLIDLVKLKSNHETIYKIAFLNRIEQNDAVIKIITEELKKQELTISYELSLYLFLFVAYFSIYDIKNGNKIRKILLKRKYHNCYEYGFILRNLQLGESYSNSLINIDKSIKHFQKFDSAVYEGHSRITKMMQLTRLGRLEKAEQELIIIKNLLENRSREKHYIHINQAVLNLYKTMLCKEKHHYDKIEYDLNLSLKISEKAFYKAAVYNNLMVLYILKEEYEKVEQCILILDKILDNQSNKSLKNRIYYNIYRYYLNMDNVLNQIYLNQVNISSTEMNDFWRNKLYNEPCNNEDYQFLAQFDYILILTSYWHFDISQIE